MCEIASIPPRTLSKAPPEIPPGELVSNLTVPGRAHLGNTRNDGEFKLVSVLPKECPEVGPLGFRSGGGPEGVSFLEGDIDDVDGDETVGDVNSPNSARGSTAFVF